MSVSKHLSARQLAGIEKVGDVLIPGDEESPRFSASGCVASVDRVLDFMPAQDLSDLKLLLTLLSWLPAGAVAAFLGFLERGKDSNGPLWGVLRLIRVGLRGLVMTLYYAQPAAADRLGYKVGVYTADLG